MNKKKKNHNFKSSKGFFLLLITYLLLMGLLILERFPISYGSSSTQTAGIGSDSVPEVKDPVGTGSETESVSGINNMGQNLSDSGSGIRPFDCLIIWDSADENSQQAYEVMTAVFHDMQISSVVFDYSDQPGILSDFLNEQSKCVVLIPDLSIMGEDETVFFQWIRAGGNAMFGTTLWMDDFVEANLEAFGISEAGRDYVLVDTFSVGDGLVGSGNTFTITDSFECAWDVRTLDTATVYLWTNNETQTPILWKNDVDHGRIVMVNLGIYQKNVRGIYAAAYSFLGDACIWPVINSVTWYLDDFPSPTPYDYSTYIQRDYGIDIASFYSDIWMPDIFSLTSRYGIRFTGGLIENYEDQTDENVVRNDNTSTFQYFGNLLLKNKGEIAIHGYNHQPLVLDSSIYEGEFSYDVWTSQEAIRNALSEVEAFTKEQFENETATVYIPPSNILGQEARSLIGSDEQLQAIASVYLGDSENLHYAQEFNVSEDGIVNIPRITSGEILENYDWVTAFSELNFHYVNTHFIHPDDVMDDDRGAANGWAKMFQELSSYASWVNSSAAGIRYLTASELAAAVQRFASSQQILKNSDNLYTISSCESGSSYLVRLNHGSLGQVNGGTVTNVSSGLYLICADAEEISIMINE